MVSSPTFGFATKEFFRTSWLLAQLETLFIRVFKDIVSMPVLEEDLKQERLNMCFQNGENYFQV